MTATEAAPASTTAGAVSRVIPPMATTGRLPADRAARRTASRPTAAYPVSFVRVPRTGPTAR